MNDKLNYKETANLLGVPIGTLYSWVSRKQIPHHRYGLRLVRFSKQVIESWISKHYVEANDENRGDV